MLCDVPVSIDHLALAAADAEASARWFAEILGLAAPLPDDLPVNGRHEGEDVAFAPPALELVLRPQR